MNLEEDYIDEHTSLNNEYMCRICLENDILNELIYPCKCSGNSKYVHKKCLDEWRSINHNPENFYRCEVCHHKYDIVEITSCKVKCLKCIIKHWFLFIVANFGLICLFGSLFNDLDKKRELLTEFGICQLYNNTLYLNNTKTDYYNCEGFIETESIPLFYALISGIGLFILSVFFIVCSFCMVKNKKLYCEYYHNSFKIVILFFLSFVFLSMVLPFGIIIDIAIVQLFCLYILQLHFITIFKMSDSGESFIKNYEYNYQMTDL